MSSNIHIAKKCEFCEERFIARTVHTRFAPKPVIVRVTSGENARKR